MSQPNCITHYGFSNELCPAAPGVVKLPTPGRLRSLFSSLVIVLATVLGLPLLLIAAGCGGANMANVTTPTAPTVTASLSPASISAGNLSTLTVAATNATGVTVSGTDGSSYTMAGTGGTHSVNPTTTTTYTATATGTGGTTSATAVLTVNGSAAAPTVTISANPASISAGSSSTLTVAATSATTLTLTGSDGSTYQIAATGGTQAVTPAATTTYTATATNPAGSVVATATVTVVPAGGGSGPTVTLSANPTSITTGNTSTLSVAAANATAVTVNGSDGSSYPQPITGGVFSVKPTKTTTYTATATGGGVTVTSAPVTVNVTATVGAMVAISASPTSITSGSTSTLTVVASNDTAVTISGSDGTNYTLSSTIGGQQSVTPLQTTTYTATAVGATGNVTATTTVTVSANPVPTVTIVANPASVVAGNASTLTVAASNDTSVTVSGTDGTSYATLPAAGGTLSVTPASTTTYTATATGAGGTTTQQTTVTVTAAGSVKSIDHVIFMMQENHSFDNYFGMLNPYRVANNFNKGDDGVTYNVDGIDDKLATITNQDDECDTYPLFKLKSTCVDDETSAWLSSYGDVNRYNFTATRPINMDGFVHNGEGFAKSCVASGTCSGTFSDTTGQRVMGYYDEGFLNYYYYMASQFALSNRWFSPMSSKSISNRISTFTGGTTQGLVNDPGNDDHLPQLNINNIFAALDAAKVSWKIYYTVSTGLCLSADDCSASANPYYPATDFSNLSYSYQYLYQNPTKAACTGTTIGSQAAVGDPSNSFCIDPNHIAKISQYMMDLQNGTLPSFSFIEAGYGNNDEHPGSGQSVLSGQAQVAGLVNALMASSSWKDSVFFLTYDEGGGPYDHVPPVPGHSNDKTNIGTLGLTPPDIASIAVNPDSYLPCLPPNGTATTNCDLHAGDPGTNAAQATYPTAPVDAVSQQGFAAQLGFRLPNMIISPFTRKHYVSNTPMDHTAIIKFVEDRFIGNGSYLTNRDKAQPNLLEFFDFTNTPWLTPPTPPSPVTPTTLGYDPCTPTTMGP